MCMAVVKGMNHILLILKCLHRTHFTLLGKGSILHVPLILCARWTAGYGAHCGHGEFVLSGRITYVCNYHLIINICNLGYLYLVR